MFEWRFFSTISNATTATNVKTINNKKEDMDVSPEQFQSYPNEVKSLWTSG
jgi:hypothetical protein